MASSVPPPGPQPAAAAAQAQCSSSTPALTASELQHALEHQLSPEWYVKDKKLQRDWTVAASTEGDNKLSPFITATRFIEQVARVAEQQQHHPDIHLTQYQHVKVSLYTHAAKCISRHDIKLAAAIDALPQPPLSHKHRNREQIKAQEQEEQVKAASQPNPILLDFPAYIQTPRLIIRPAQAGDGALVNAAVMESLAELQPYMPWTNPPPTVQQSEEVARRFASEWIARSNISMAMIDRETGRFVGGTGLHRFKWDADVISFDIGYWIRTSCHGKGYATEAANAMARFADKYIRLDNKPIRTELIIFERNPQSQAVAERLHARVDRRLPRCPITDAEEPTRIYVVDVDQLPPLQVEFVDEKKAAQ